MFHLTGWYESIDQAGAYAALAAIQDPAINTSGDDIRISAELPFICGAAGLTAATVLTAAQLRSPSLRTLNNLEIRPLINALVFADPPQPMMFPRNPRAMTPAEDLQCWIDANPGSAEGQYGLTWMCDGPIAPVNGEIFTVGASAAISQAAGTWVNGNITFGQQLPSGSYHVVGMRAEAANLVAARLVFPGGGANAWRPGVPACVAIGTKDADYFRFGQMGVFGTFDQDNPPTLDVLGVTNTAQVLTFDLIKTA